MANTKVTTNVIADDAITGAKIADDAINSEHYTDGSIDTAHIADDQVTLAKMAGIARGKIIYGDSSGNPAVLAVGSNGQVLKSDGTDISWGTDSSNDRDGAAVFNESGAAVDFRIEGDTEQNLFFVDGSADKIGIGTASPATTLDIVTGSTGSSPYVATAITMAPSNFTARTWQLRMDDGGAAGYGFSIAAAGNRILYLNNNNRVGINQVSPTKSLEVAGDTLISKAGDGNTPTMHIIDTADTEVAWFEGNRAGDTGAFISLWHKPSSAAGTNRSGIKFQAPDAGNNKTQYAMMMMEIDSNTEGSEDGQLGFHLIDDGSLNEILTIKKDRLLYKGRSGSSIIRVDNRADGHDTGFEIYQNGSRKWEIVSDDSNTDALDIRNNAGAQKFTMTQTGRLGIGTTSPAEILTLVASSGDANIRMEGSAVRIKKSGVDWLSYDGANLKMSTGNSERARFNNSGTFSIGTTSGDNTPDSSGSGFIYSGQYGWCAIATSQAAGLYINRTGDSGGDLVSFRSSGSEKGTISISGSTVSYNAFMGSHYTETTGDDPLLGTVMEFTGELVENRYASQKRLSKAKVSDTAESTKVYGVYLSDSSEDTGELIASLGASWCRIHKDETIAIGDLLVSKGDGTAKVQSDDIIRSKTIGKVTSTTKKEIYEDDSYIVPVVLYCG